MLDHIYLFVIFLLFGFSLIGYIFVQLKHCVRWIKTNTVKFHNLLNYWYGKVNCLNINLQLLTIWLPVNQLPFLLTMFLTAYPFTTDFSFIDLSPLTINPSMTVFSTAIPSNTFRWHANLMFYLQYVKHKSGLCNSMTILLKIVTWDEI